MMGLYIETSQALYVLSSIIMMGECGIQVNINNNNKKSK